jgi:hypothetical protein
MSARTGAVRAVDKRGWPLPAFAVGDAVQIVGGERQAIITAVLRHSYVVCYHLTDSTFRYFESDIRKVLA